ncbi:MAG TPA: PaaI family thioesterase [Roseimicrobium sp.]|nr:PaaI family thioesterase [Roseimicrobium sp.]
MHGLRLRFETDGETVTSRFVPTENHIGFRQTIHGGILATVLDEIMVWACAVGTRRFAYCAEMTTRFQRPAAPGVPLIVTSKLVENRRNRIFSAMAEVRTEDGMLLAEATGKYMPVPEASLREMMVDLIGDTAPFEPPTSTPPGV